MPWWPKRPKPSTASSPNFAEKEGARPEDPAPKGEFVQTSAAIVTTASPQAKISTGRISTWTVASPGLLWP